MATHSRFFMALLLVSSAGAAAQDTVVKHVAAKPTSAASGKQMYVNYCAACHGSDGKGGGPAAPALKVPPTDLTALSQNNKGKFPVYHVESVIRGESEPPSHGSQEMPVWGPVFLNMSQGHSSEVQQLISNLTQYIESLQAK